MDRNEEIREKIQRAAERKRETIAIQAGTVLYCMCIWESLEYFQRAGGVDKKGIGRNFFVAKKIKQKG